MKKIIPFKKEINFKTNIAEIVSISLEHTLKLDTYLVDGEFIVSGEYKMADISTNTEKFNFNLPFNISIDEKYTVDKVTIDIDDFYYEIVNDKTLIVNIDVSVNNLEEKIQFNEQEVINEISIEQVNRCIENEIKEEDFFKQQIDEEKPYKEENPIIIEDTTKKLMKENSILDSFGESESFETYRVYIVREGDTIESILEKYNITKEILEKYNDLTEIKIGDKLIIPS